MFNMDVQQPSPSNLLQLLSQIARWSLRLLLAAWLVFLLAWGALHLFIVPRIDEMRPLLERQVSKALGLPVKIGVIRAQSRGIIPSFELLDIRLLDPQGREALRLPRVLASLSPRSVWSLGFEQLYIEQPELDIRRAKDGTIFVAGLDFSKSPDETSSVSDWFFSQVEFAVRGGTVTWQDDLRDAPPLVLKAVDFVVRNKSRKHALRLDATPPTEWGGRFSIRAEMRQPFLLAQAGQWRAWEGQVYAGFERLDVRELRRYLDLGINLAQGQGALRAWLDVSRGDVIGAAIDVAMTQVQVSRNPNQALLVLPSLVGRVSARQLPGGYELATQNLQFETQEGLRWPGGNIRVSRYAADNRQSERGELQGDRLDLAALSLIAARLSLEHAWLEVLKAYAPQGLVERMQLSWQGPLSAPSRFDAKGKVTGLALAARVSEPEPGSKTRAPQLLTPGLRSATVDFDLNQAGGRAALEIAQGSVSLPTLFDEPELALTQFSSDIRWQIDGQRLSVQLPNMKFSNDDAQGDAQLKWQSLPAKNASFSLGQLDLQGGLSRATANRVYRYLPLDIDAQVRDYLRASLLKGQASAVKFRVKGDLDNFPFEKDRSGEFRLTANVRDASFAAVPPSLQPAGVLPWPVLTQVNAELLIDRNKLQVKDINARVAGAAGLRVTRAEATIADYLDEAIVRVSADARGPVGEALTTVVNSSPLGVLTGQVLSQASANGNADLQLNLTLPIAAIEKFTVLGKLTLGNNELQLLPETPRITRARAVVYFTEGGFAITGGQARMLGGDLRAEGGSIVVPQGAATTARTQAPPALRIQGTFTADGLRAASELGKLTQLAPYLSGSSNYLATIGWRRGLPEVLVTSTLQGLALNLPAPLNKAAETPLPLRVETTLLRGVAGGAANTATEDQIRVELGRLLSVSFVRDISSAEPRVLRGGIGVGLHGSEAVPTPAQGVGANLNFATLDLDAWTDLYTKLAEPQSSSASAGARGLPAKPPSLAGAGGLAGAGLAGYWPNTLALRANELTLWGRKINNLVAGGSLDGQVLRLNLDARELGGYLEYRQPLGSTAGQVNPGQVYARLARLSLAQSSVKEVEALLVAPPTTVPALDVVVDDFELRGLKLGRVEIEAVNRGSDLMARQAGVREWRLNKFNVSMPEASFSATGNWAALGETSAPANRGATQRPAAERRRTVMNFKLDIADAGDLLNRFGMKEVIRKGKGKMEGQVAWLGSPLALDYPSLGGTFVVNVENGQFLKAEPGIAKLLGVLSLQSLPRRLTLDFRDVFSEGFSFDFFRGDITIEQGIASTNNLQMKGVNAAVFMEGRADLARETQNLKVVVVPEINAGTASLLAAWVNPAVGIGTFLAQLFLRRPLMESATQEFQVDGSWTEPKIVKVEGKR
jgi:uncharacterized protein (TIGR02099 family)